LAVGDLLRVPHNLPLVSVVTVNYNGFHYLRKSVASILKSDYPSYEIIVVDNGSSDCCVKQIKTEFGKYKDVIRLVFLKTNLGFSIGNNIGAKKSNGKYILFLNNDTEIDPDGLSELVKTLECDQTIGAAQAKLLFMDKKLTFDSAGVFLNVIGFGRTRGFLETDHGQYDQIDEISYAKGAAMVVQRSVWTKLGGFEQLFFAYFEETDFCWRVWLAGLRVVFVPSARVFHVGGGTISKYSNREFQFQDYRNRLVVLVKNLQLGSLVKYSPWVLIVYFNRVRLHIRNRDFQGVLANLQAVIWCIRFFKIVWTKRLLVYPLRRVSDNYLFKKGIISKTISL
jgi:GT2 family glycosyltransferase